MFLDLTQPYNLIHGDCLIEMDRIPTGSVDAIIADWPYNATECKWDSVISLEPLWEQCKRIIKINGAIILSANEPFTSILVTSNIEQYRHKWVWEKDKAGNFFHAPYMPIDNCEDILVFNQCGYAVNSRNKPTYNPQMTKADTYHTHTKSKSVGGFSLRQIVNRKNPTPLESRSDYDGWLRYPKSKIYFPVPFGKARLHPTQKPVALMEYLIKTYTNPGDLILDNTMGSASTGEACLRTGRRFIGIEKDEGYFEIAKSRMEKVSQELRNPVQLEFVTGQLNQVNNQPNGFQQPQPETEEQ